MLEVRQGNCTKLLREIPKGTIDCVITSPPFWRGPQGTWAPEEIGGERNPTTYVRKIIDLFAQVRWTLAPTADVWIVIGQGARTLGTPEGRAWTIINELARDGWCIAAATAWDDAVVTLIRQYQRDGNGCPVPPYKDVLTDRPYAPLASKFVEYCLKHSTTEQHVVLDPCCGSGTVGIVAASMDRQFRGIELNIEQAQLAQDRISYMKT